MKKYLSFLFLFALALVPSVIFAQTSSTVSKVVSGSVVKKYVPPTVSPTSDTPAKILGNGAKSNSIVTMIQARLLNLGIYRGSVDGVYGPGTTKAVAELQQRFDLIPDGKYGPDTQNILALIPADAYLRTIDASTVLKIKNAYKAQKINANSSQIASVPASTTKTTLARIPFTPAGIVASLSSALKVPNLTEVSTTSKTTAKPKTTSSKVALYSSVLSSGGVGSQSSSLGLSKNYSTGVAGSSSSSYVCGRVNNIESCVPVPIKIAQDIKDGKMTLEQFLSGQSPDGNPCVRCYLDENGNTLGSTSDPWWGSDPNIPDVGLIRNTTKIVDMCMDYPFSNTRTVAYEVKFDKKVNVNIPSGASIKLEVLKYYARTSKKITANYTGLNYLGDTMRFSVPLGSEQANFFEGEGSIKLSGGATITSLDGSVINYDILPDFFNLGDPCTNSKTYDIVGTESEFQPGSLLPGESFADKRINVKVHFDSAVRVTGQPRIIVNPSDSGRNTTGYFVPNQSSSDTLMFHIRSTPNTDWVDLFGQFMIDLNGGTITSGSGQPAIIVLPAGMDHFEYPCELKYTGSVCVTMGDGTATYNVVYDRPVNVDYKGDKSNIKLLVDTTSLNIPVITATLTNVSTDGYKLTFVAPSITNYSSDHVGHATLSLSNGATIYGSGRDVPTDLGDFTATCDGNDTTPPPMVGDICFKLNYGNKYATYKVTFPNPVTVDYKGTKSNVSLSVDTPGTPNFVTPYLYGTTDNKSLFFGATGTSVELADYVGLPVITFANGATVKDLDGVNVEPTLDALTVSQLCTD